MSAPDRASTARQPRLVLRLLVPLLCLISLALGGTVPASAHASLVSSDPANNSVLAEAPRTATLAFSEPVTLGPDAVELFDARGRAVASSASSNGGEVKVDLPHTLTPGSYVLTWRLVSQDGHPISGSITFAVGRASATIVRPGEAAPADAGVGTALQVTRVVTYLALFVAAGLLLFLGWVLPREPGTVPVVRRIRTVLGPSSLVAVLSALVSVALNALHQHSASWSALGSSEVWQWALIRDDLLTAVVMAAGLGIGTVLVARTRSGDTVDLRLLRWAPVGALVALAAPAISGHTRSTQPFVVMIASDVVHVVAGAFWLGGLLGLLVTLRHTTRLAATRATVARFSTDAAGVLLLLAASGAVMGWRIVGDWASLFGTAYGQLLVVKVGVVAVAALLAAWNRWWLLPRLTRKDDPKARRHLHRTLLVEALALVAVLALTGVLTGRSPQDAAASASSRTPTFATGQLDSEHEVLVLITPQVAGPTTLHVHLVTADGRPVEPFSPPVVSLSSSGRDLGRIDLVAGGEGVYTAKVLLPTPGEWEVRTSVRLDEFTNPVASVTVPVADRGR